MKKFVSTVFATPEVRRGIGHLLVGVVIAAITAVATRDA
jgi:hypothetical protein